MSLSTAIVFPLGNITLRQWSKEMVALVISAASIIAKVTRDAEMLTLDRQYPGYGFAKNKGYGTPQHLEALSRLVRQWSIVVHLPQ